MSSFGKELIQSIHEAIDMEKQRANASPLFAAFDPAGDVIPDTIAPTEQDAKNLFFQSERGFESGPVTFLDAGSAFALGYRFLPYTER